MDPFVGEIRIFAGNFAPRGWALCNGQLMAISQNTALYSLLGTYYGGDGRATFGLPDMQGRAPMHWGNGAGLSPRSLGEKAGTPSVTLLTPQLPAHPHTLNAESGRVAANQPSPAGNAFGRPGANLYVSPATNIVQMSASAVGSAGGNQAHNNEQPYLAMSFIIALTGVYPQRS